MQILVCVLNYDAHDWNMLKNQIRWIKGYGIDQWTVIDETDDLFQFWLFGRGGRDRGRTGKAALGHYLEPRPVWQTAIGGYRSLSVSLKQATRRAPTPALRMKILERDGYRCRICGQSSNLDTNVVLHVHHVRPWSERGITDKANLVTLCHTCHSGLDPHHNPDLVKHLGDPSWESQDVAQGIVRLRELLKSAEYDD